MVAARRWCRVRGPLGDHHTPGALEARLPDDIALFVKVESSLLATEPPPAVQARRPGVGSSSTSSSS